MKSYLALLALPLLAAGPVFATTPPSSIGPTKTAWYDASYPTTTPAPPPAPPGVGATDLLVAGATVPVPPPVGQTLRAIEALAAVSFTVPAGSTAASFTLELASGPSTATGGARLPTGVALEACPSTDAFTAGGHQAFDTVPAYDCTGRTSIASLSADGTKVVFSDIGRVARGKLLAFVIRPGTTGLDRLVFTAPGPHSLTLLSFDSAPAFDGGGTPVLPPVPVLPQPTTAPGQPLPPVGVGQLPGLPSASPAASLAPPVISQEPATSAAAQAKPDDGRVRTIALAGLALLVVGVSWLTATDRRTSETEWGFGRYRGPRSGRAPSL